MIRQAGKSITRVFNTGVSPNQLVGATNSHQNTVSITVTGNTNPFTPGNTLIVTFAAGNVTRTITPPAGQGWIQLPGGMNGVQTMYTFVKKCGASEPGSYAFTVSSTTSQIITWSLNEFINIDIDLIEFDAAANTAAVNSGGTTGTLTSMVLPALVYPRPCFVWTVLATNDLNSWTAAAPGYTFSNSGLIREGRQKLSAANAPLGFDAVITWTGPSSTNVRAEAYALPKKHTK